MARAQDGGSGLGEPNRASLERDRDENPQQDRVGFEQVMDSLGVRYPLEDKLAESKASEGEYLFGEEETTVVTIPARLHNRATSQGVRGREGWRRNFAGRR